MGIKGDKTYLLTAIAAVSYHIISIVVLGLLDDKINLLTTAPAVRCCDDISQKTFSKCFPSADIIGNKCTQLSSSLVMPPDDRRSSAVYFALSREFACIDPVKQKTCKYDFFLS